MLVCITHRLFLFSSEKASTGIDWSQLQQLIVQDLIPDHQMQSVLAMVGLSRSQVETILKDSFNIQAAPNLLDDHRVTVLHMVAAMSQAGISNQYIRMILSDHKGSNGAASPVKLDGILSQIEGTDTNGTDPTENIQLPGGMGTLPVLKPDVPSLSEKEAHS